MPTKRLVAAALAGLLSTVALADAQTLEVRLAADISSIDPHYQSQSPNAAMSRNIFDTMVIQDPDQKLVPGLAVSWKAIDETTWEFKLREGVTFHDGTPFTAEDVAYTIKRIPELDSPGSLERYVRPITNVEVVDEHTIRLSTEDPFPMLPNYMSGFVIVSKAAVDGAPLDAFNTGEATVGTGPFKFDSWVPGTNVKLSRNEDYWAGASDFEQVNINFVAEDAARVTQLLSGEADFIDQVPPQLVERLKADPDVKIVAAPSYRFLYVAFNHSDKATDYVFGPNGETLDESPFKDVRVREALSLAINRKAISERVMGGFSQPASQINLPGAGASPNQPDGADLYDPEKAKQLLADAGYPDGLTINFIAPNDSYINDAQIAQAIAQMFARINVKANLETMPNSVAYDRMNPQEFGVFLFGHGATTGEPMGSLSNLLGTFDKSLGRGSSNRGRYSNPTLDEMLDTAARTIDEEKRSKILHDAIDLVMEDQALIPIQHQFTIYAMRKGVNYTPRADERFLAVGLSEGDS